MISTLNLIGNVEKYIINAMHDYSKNIIILINISGDDGILYKIFLNIRPFLLEKPVYTTIAIQFLDV